LATKVQLIQANKAKEQREKAILAAIVKSNDKIVELPDMIELVDLNSQNS